MLNQLRAAPNLLTLLRLFIIPALVLTILDGNYLWACALFALAGVSDALDGLLARWLDQQTELGLILDPITDKLLLSTLFIVLTHVNLVPRYVTVMVFSRDLGLVLIGTLLYTTTSLSKFPPSLFGKLNTCIQILALALVLVGQRGGGTGLHVATVWVLRLTACCALASGFEYLVRVIRRLDKEAAA